MIFWRRTKTLPATRYVRWTRSHKAEDLTIAEQVQWETLVDLINAALE